MVASIQPVPQGYHTVTINVIVRDIAESIDFYRRAFGAEELFRMDGPDGSVMHAEIKIGDSRIMLGSESRERGCFAPASLQGHSTALYIYTPDVDAAFDRAIKAGGKSTMPVDDMFWGDRAGSLVDPSGHNWTLATHKEDLTPEEIRHRSEAFFAAHASS